MSKTSYRAGRPSREREGRAPAKRRGDAEGEGKRAPAGKSPSSKKDEQKYYGLNAVQAIFTVRPNDIIRAYALESRKREMAEILRWCAKERKAYRFVDAEELEKLTASTHHEGVCVLAKRRNTVPFVEALETLKPGLVLFLDGVQNPHNLGSIVRTAAHFGVALILGEEQRIPSLSASTCRVAEGGAEYVTVSTAQDASKALKALRQKGYTIVSTSSHAEREAYGYSFSKNTVLLLGSENAGVDPDLNVLADVSVSLPGTEHIESLNVSAACAAFLSEYRRQHWKKK